MAETKIFRKTPFNGYKRDDVLQYIADADARQKELIEDYEEQIGKLKEAAGDGLAEQLREENRRASERIAGFEKQIVQKEEEEALLSERIEEYRAAVAGMKEETLSAAEFTEAGEPKVKEALSAAEANLKEKQEELDAKTAETAELKTALQTAYTEACDLLSLRARLAKREGKIEEHNSLCNELSALKEQDPERAEMRRRDEEKSGRINALNAQIAQLQAEKAELLAEKVRFSETEEQLLTAKGQILVLESQNAEKAEKITKIEAAWEESKQKFLLFQKETETAEGIIKNAQTKADAIIAGAEDERRARNEAVNAEVKNILSGAVRESEKIIAAAEEKASFIIRSARLSAAEAMQKLTPMKEPLTSLLSAIRLAEQPEEPQGPHEEN